MTPIENLQKSAAVRGHVVEIETRTPTAGPGTGAPGAAFDPLPYRVTVWRNPTAGRVYRGASENAAVAAALNDYRTRCPSNSA